nr:hypothetical protein [Tanacetum cinerariifolium]
MEQMTQLTSMWEMVCQNFQKKQEEKRIEKEQAANARYWKIPACCNDDDDNDDVDYTIAITPVLSTEEPIDSLSMGDEHLDTILATESDKIIKSSVENLVPIPSEFEGIPDTMCDVHLVNNPTPLEAKYHFKIIINSNDDISSSDDDSLHKENIEYVEASPHDSKLVSLEAAEIVIPKKEEIETQNELLTSQNKVIEQMTQLTSMCELACQIVQKKQEEKRMEEEQAAKARYWKIPACYDDDDDYDFAITPVLSTEEPIDSLSMGDEHLDTIPATESDEVIKSSVEDFIPIPSEFEGIPNTMCDVHFDNNHTPLEAKDHVEIIINSNDDISSSD